jgi:hypothetical protein
MVFNATFNNISVILWRRVLLVEETRVPGENHRPVVSHWQTENNVLRMHNIIIMCQVISSASQYNVILPEILITDIKLVNSRVILCSVVTLADFINPVEAFWVTWAPKCLLKYSTFQSFDYGHIWWWLFQKPVVCIIIDIYVSFTITRSIHLLVYYLLQA